MENIENVIKHYKTETNHYKNGLIKAKYTSAKIYSIKPLSKTLYLVKTITKNEIPDPKPPQFVMTWIPGAEAIPLSIAWYDRDELWFIVKPVGETTNKLVKMQKNTYIGVYGPLGKPLLPMSRGKYLLLAGGSGLAVITHYMQKICLGKNYCETVYGAWSPEEVGIIPDYIRKLGGKPVTACLDNECDINGLATDYLDYVDIENYNYIIACGPLGMLREIASRINSRYHDKVILVLESMVKCGLGLCGSCRIFPGKNIFLCIDGPGFYLKDIREYLLGDEE